MYGSPPWFTQSFGLVALSATSLRRCICATRCSAMVMMSSVAIVASWSFCSTTTSPWFWSVIVPPSDFMGAHVAQVG